MIHSDHVQLNALCAHYCDFHENAFIRIRTLDQQETKDPVQRIIVSNVVKRPRYFCFRRNDAQVRQQSLRALYLPNAKGA